MKRFSVFIGFTTRFRFGQSVCIVFDSISIFQDAHCIKTTRFTINFNRQYFISIHNSIQPAIFHLISVRNSIQLSKFHFKSIHNSISLKGVYGVSLTFPHSCWECYMYRCIQLEIEPQPHFSQVWLVPTDRMQKSVL